jgi:hypothetical protein
MRLIIEEQSINVNVFVDTDSDGLHLSKNLLSADDADGRRFKKTRAAAAALVEFVMCRKIDPMLLRALFP